MAATKIPYPNATLYAIVPSDSDKFDPPLSAVFVGGATGDVALTHGVMSGDDVSQTNTTYSAVAAGATITGVGPITAVRSTATTATIIIGVQ